MGEIKEAKEVMGARPIKSDNIQLGCKIPLPDGTTGVIAKEVEKIDNSICR